MNFNDHSNLEGAHAILSPSKHSWLNYSEEKLVSTYLNHLAIQRGTELHAFARDAIKHGIDLARRKSTLNQYVNDANGFKMTPEVPLLYSLNCFGTADAVAYRKGRLRIHDLKTGVVPASMRQLEIYAALFFLEYGRELDIKPKDTEVELRIYQNDKVLVHESHHDEIEDVMDKIIRSDKVIEKIKQEV